MQLKALGLISALILSIIGISAAANPAAPVHHSQRPASCSITFADVPPSNIFSTYIYDLACSGVVSGIGGGNFGPALPATRGQFARMVTLGFAIPAYTPASPTFTDVPTSYFAYAYIETMAHAGISSGYQDQAQCSLYGATAPCYLPNRNISRAEATALVMRAGGYTLMTPPTPSFLDVPASNFAYAPIETAHSLGIVSGLNGYFRPNASIRRDELSRVLDLGIRYLTGTPVPTSTPAIGLMVYDDNLAAGWQDWSWDTTRDFANTSPVYAGSNSISVAYTAGFGGLYLETPSISIAQYTYLHFYVHGGTTGGQSVEAHLIDGNGSTLGGVAIDSYIEPDHTIPAGQWREVSIPMSDLGAPSSISGITFQDGVDTTEPTFYLDNISLNTGTLVQPTVTPSGGPTSTPIPTNLTYYRGVNLSGGEFGSNVPGTYGVDYTYPTAADFAYFKGKGLNFIRLPFLWERLQRTLNGPLDATELDRLDTVLGYAQAQGMYIMFEPHNFDRYQLDGTDYLVGSTQVPDSAFANFWQQFAQHYAAQPNVYYNLMNEPHDTGDHWPVSAQAAVDAIRSVDTTHTIFIPGDGWQGAWTWPDNNANLLINDPQNNLIYDAHQYFDSDGSGTYAGTYDSNGAYPTIGVDRLQPFITWLQAHNLKGFVSEYGIPNDDPRWEVVLDNFLGAMDGANLGGTYWSAGPWWGDYPLSVEPYADGSDKPQMATLQGHLGNQQ